MTLSLPLHLSRGGQRAVRAILVALALLALVYALALSLAAPSGAHTATHFARVPAPAVQCPGTPLPC